VTDLEAKNRDYEAQQIQASIELQQAARRVNEENEALKAENMRLHNENEELRRILSSHVQQCGLDPTVTIPFAAPTYQTPFIASSRVTSSSLSPGGNLVVSSSVESIGMNMVPRSNGYF
jgi:hypothetical protein